MSLDTMTAVADPPLQVRLIPGPRVAFCAGLPRSGSTLLLNLLAQRREVYCSPTSGLAGLVEGVIGGWRAQPAFQAEGLARVKPRIRRAIWGLVRGYYSGIGAELAIDKQRAWPLLLVPMLRADHVDPPRVLLPVRDLRDVIASFELLHRQRDIDEDLRGPAYHLDIAQRAEALLAPGGVVGSAIAATRVALHELPLELMIPVPYADLCARPREVLAVVEQRLDLEPFDYELEQIEQVTHESDEVWGMGQLHTVQPTLEPRPPRWPGIVPDELAARIENAYPRIQALSRMTIDQATYR